MVLSALILAAFGMPITLGAVLDATSQAETKPPAISVVLRAEHDMVKIGEPIVLKETLTNRSDHEITFGRDTYHPGCPVDVVDEKGKSAADKKPGYRRGSLDLQEAARTMPPEQLVKSGLLTGSAVWIALKPGKASSRVATSVVFTT
jgi:hypothetical protein